MHEAAEGLWQDLALIKLRTGIMGKPVAPLQPLVGICLRCLR
jgi:hypothetical protein